MDESDEIAARRAAVMAEARRRAYGPGWAWSALGATEVIATAGGWAFSHSVERPDVALLCVATLACGPLAAIAGKGLRRMRGWNIAFAGGLASISLWAAVALAAWLEPRQMVIVAMALVLMAANAALVVVTAWLLEEPHVAAARRWLEPAVPADLRDYGPM